MLPSTEPRQKGAPLALLVPVVAEVIEPERVGVPGQLSEADLVGMPERRVEVARERVEPDSRRRVAGVSGPGLDAGVAAAG